MGKYTIDLATLQIINKCSYNIYIKTQSLWCYQCEPYLVSKIPKYGNSTLHFNTTHQTLIDVKYENENDVYTNCRKIYQFGDHGNYQLDVWDAKGFQQILNLYQSKNESTCEISVIKEPLNSNLPILWFTFLAILFLTLWNLRHYARKKCGNLANFSSVFGHRSPLLTNGVQTFGNDTVSVRAAILPSSPQDPLPNYDADDSLLDVGEPSLLTVALELPDGKKEKMVVGVRYQNNDLIVTNEQAYGSMSNIQSSDLSTGYAALPTASSDPQTRGRLIFLDTFRGMTVTLMIFFNYGGGKYWFFQHAPWNGMTFADIVFPLHTLGGFIPQDQSKPYLSPILIRILLRIFVFAMGFSFDLSFRKKIQRGSSKRSLAWDILRRSVVLFIIGFILSNMDSKTQITHFRIMGVLQRLALVYLLLASGFLLASLPKRRQIFMFKSSVFIEIVLVTLLCTLQLPYFIGKAPGCPRGYNGPGGMYMNSSYPTCTGGFYAYVDRVILGSNHIYQNPTCKKIYITTAPFDPEGIMGTFSATLLAYFGAHAAYHFATNYSSKNYLRIILGGIASFIIMGCLAGALCGFKREGGWVPLNKNLWSLSYTFATGALSYLLLTLFFVLIHVSKLWDGLPFNFVGMNPLLIYMGHEIFRNYFPFNLHLGHKYMNSHTYIFMQDIWACMLWLLIAYFLYKRKVFVSL